MRSRAMQLSPQALPFEQTLQQLAAKARWLKGSGRSVIVLTGSLCTDAPSSVSAAIRMAMVFMSRPLCVRFCRALVTSGGSLRE